MPSTVTNIIKDAGGTPVSGASVAMDLVVLSGGNATSIQGFYPATTFSINIASTVQTNSNGVWSIGNVPGNDAIEDSSGQLGTTHWKVTETAQGVSRSYFLKFGNGIGGTIWAGNYTDQNTLILPSTFPHSVTIPAPSSILMTSALTRLNVGAILDLAFATEIRMNLRVRVGATGLALLQYSTDNSTWTTLSSINTATTGVFGTGYMPIPGSLRTMSYWQLATSSGNDTTATIDLITLNYR